METVFTLYDEEMSVQCEFDIENLVITVFGSPTVFQYYSALKTFWKNDRRLIALPFPINYTFLDEGFYRNSDWTIEGNILPSIVVLH